MIAPDFVSCTKLPSQFRGKPQGWLRLSFLSVLDYHSPDEYLIMRIFLTATLLVCCALEGSPKIKVQRIFVIPHRLPRSIMMAGLPSKEWCSAANGEAMRRPVYLPDKEIADGGVVFSHSAIHADTGASVDLLPFALTLARAGAAVVVPRRTLT